MRAISCPQPTLRMNLAWEHPEDRSTDGELPASLALLQEARMVGAFMPDSHAGQPRVYLTFFGAVHSQPH